MAQKHSHKTAEPVKTVLATEAEIDKICEEAKHQIYDKVQAHVDKHPGDAFSGHYLVDLEKSLKALYKMTGNKVAGAFKKGLPTTMQAFYAQAAEDMKTRGTRNAILGKVDERRINDQLDSAFQQVAMRTTKMTFQHIQQLRQISAEVFRTATLTGASRKEVTRQLLDKARQIPGFKFVANNGVVWSDQAYFKMLARTELMQAGRRSYEEKCAEEGYDIVRLDYSGDSCDACGKWEGKLFSLTGATPGLPTKDELVADGVFHPNCTHSYTAVTDFELAEMGLEMRQPGTADDDLADTAPVDVSDAEATRAAEQIEAQRAAWPDDPEALRVVRSLGGSTGAEMVEDEDGNRYVRKHGGSAGGDAAAHLRNECAADNFYRAMGIDVPENRLYETDKGPVKLSRFVDGGENLGSWWSHANADERREMLAKLRPGFDLDVVTGNWDVIGMGADNILVDKDGRPWRIDNGGALGYRAQGAQKKPEEWAEGWPDDLWTMRTSSNNKAFFGDIDTLDLCRTISERDYSEALKGLQEADRKVIERRLDEIKQLAERGAPFKADGYRTDCIDTMLKASYDLCKDGLRDKMKVQITLGGSYLPVDYGPFRSGSSGSNGIDPMAAQNTNIQQTVLAAVKTVNLHNGQATGKSGSGDHKPNQTSIDAAVALKPELEKLAKQGNTGAAYYLRKIEQMEDAAKAGTTIAGKQLDTHVEVYQPKPQAHVAADKRSFTTQVYEYIAKQSVTHNGKTIQLDPYFIARSQDSQAGDSYGADACKMKIVRLNAMGIKPGDAERKGYYMGKGTYREHNMKDAMDYYKDYPDELLRDTETFMQYQGALQVMLENTDLPYADKATRTILLGRTESGDVLRGMRAGQEATHGRGVVESHAMFRSVSVHGGELTIVRVPFDRINGCFMCEREPGSNGSGFLGDGENEMTADTNGLKVLYVGHAGNGKDLKPYYDKYIQWEKNGYK